MPLRKERLTYREHLRRLLAGPLLRVEERRRAEGILAIPDDLEIAVQLASLLDGVSERRGLIRLGRHASDGPTVRRYLDPATNDYWTVEVPGPRAVQAQSRSGPAPPPAAPTEKTTPTPPQIVRPVQVVTVEPTVARRFLDEATGEPLRTLFGTFSSCRTPEEMGAAVRPIRDQLVQRTSASSATFHIVADEGGSLTPIPMREVATSEHEPLAGRVTDHVLGEHRMLHVPDLSVGGTGAGPEATGALVSAALTSGDRLVGLLEVHRDTPGAFRDDELQLFRVAALSAGGALARAEILEKLIFLDRLTGLYNRAYFDDQIGREIERANRNGTSVALIMADLDFFKRINDTYGHQVGDQALRHFGSIMKSNIRQIDVAARYGGEEFALLLPSINRARSQITAERLCRVVAETRFGDVIPELANEKITVSVGFALYPDDAATAKQLIDRADRVALYSAKNRGRNRVVAWSAIRETGTNVK